MDDTSSWLSVILVGLFYIIGAYEITRKKQGGIVENNFGLTDQDKSLIDQFVKMFNAQWIKVGDKKYIVPKKSVGKTEAQVVRDEGRF